MSAGDAVEKSKSHLPSSGWAFPVHALSHFQEGCCNFKTDFAEPLPPVALLKQECLMSLMDQTAVMAFMALFHFRAKGRESRPGWF